MIKVVTWKSKCNNHLSPISWLKIVKFTDFTKLQGKLVSRNFFCTVLWKKQIFLLIFKNVREINSHKTLVSRKFCWTIIIVKFPQCYVLEKFVKSIDFLSIVWIDGFDSNFGLISRKISSHCQFETSVLLLNSWKQMWTKKL